MSDPVRLLESSGNSRARDLLSAALADAPSPDALPRVATALGLAAGAVSVAVPVAAANGAVVAVAAKPLASGTSLIVLSKWLATGALGGVLVSGTVAVVEHVREPEPARSAVAAPTAAPARRVARAVPPGALNPLPEPPEIPTPEAPAAAQRPRETPSAAPTPHDQLGAEAARVDAARRALSRGDLAEASRELDRYQAERSIGVLDREMLLLRIQVLVRRGEHERAVILARSYLGSHPNDAHAARLEALIESGGASWPGPQGIER